MRAKKPKTTTVSSRYFLGEAASRFEGSERDVVSETGAVGKLCPGMALRVGCSFRKEVLGETVPRSDPKYWDIASLS